ncbi:MAG: glycosyltransferase family 2 protein [Actinobacteria bacterium]|nr:glycosyltransferase family 2 protein [Cyanobacteriota bacterium]MCL5772241.1 glycosyltransferase family 2 protein [Actinomycetota bacterium]
MFKSDKIYIIIPAYNEASLIPTVLNDLINNGYKNIIVVDDGSTDNTSGIVKNFNVDLIKHPVNMGPGAAIKTGIDYALLKNAKIMITFDADGQHLAKDIPNLISPIINNQAEITLGNRFINNMSNVPVFKKIILKLGAFLMFLMYGILSSDSHNGLKAISKSAALKINIKSNGWEYCSEIIEEIMLKKIKYIEVPVTVNYSDYSIKKGQKIYNSFYIVSKMFLKWIFG